MDPAEERVDARAQQAVPAPVAAVPEAAIEPVPEASIESVAEVAPAPVAAALGERVAGALVEAEAPQELVAEQPAEIAEPAEEPLAVVQDAPRTAELRTDEVVQPQQHPAAEPVSAASDAEAAAPAKAVAKPRRGSSRRAARISADETLVAIPPARVPEPAFTPAAAAMRFEELPAFAAARVSERPQPTPELPVAPPEPLAPTAHAVPQQYPGPVERQAEPDAVLALATREAEPNDRKYSAATRLGGLRNLMTSLGVKNLHKEMEVRRTTQRNLESDFENPAAKPAERPVYAEPERPAPSANGRVNTPVREVKAQPEIIPPKTSTEAADREAPAARQAKAPPSRWDVLDDVETLPSKRGQYRKRR
jgi:hypothetical protein